MSSEYHGNVGRQLGQAELTAADPGWHISVPRLRSLPGRRCLRSLSRVYADAVRRTSAPAWIASLALLAVGCPTTATTSDAGGGDADVGIDAAFGTDASGDRDASDDAASIVHDAGAVDEEPPLTADEAAAFLAITLGCPGGMSVSALDDFAVDGAVRRSHQMSSFARLARCVAETGGADCLALTACGYPAGTVGGTCATPVLRCVGETLEVCNGTSARSVDCAAVGEHCVASSATACGEGACTDSSCDADGLGGHWCAGGISTALRCRTGYRCEVPTGWFGVDCNGNGAACTASTCVGGAYIECQAGHEVPPVDCASVGGTCSPTAGCVPSASECVPGAAQPTCTGAVIHYCSPSHTLASVDCAALGFTSCVATTGSGAWCMH